MATRHNHNIVTIFYNYCLHACAIYTIITHTHKTPLHKEGCSTKRKVGVKYNLYTKVQRVYTANQKYVNGTSMQNKVLTKNRLVATVCS